jgi:prefoldin beta subunit
MDIDKETQQKIKQLQIFEQNFQTILMQKQAFQMELTETENALSEIAKSKGDIYKMIGQIMIKTDKNKVESELKRKQELLSLRLKTLEKQESELTEQLEDLRTEIMKKVK